MDGVGDSRRVGKGRQSWRRCCYQDDNGGGQGRLRDLHRLEIWKVAMKKREEVEVEGSSNLGKRHAVHSII